MLTQIVISWLSRSFVFGIGHTERPIIAFLVLEFIAFGFYFAAVEWVRRLPEEPGSHRKIVFWILLIGILSRLVFLPSNLIQETDPYRYIWDGQTVLSGENPYRHSPEEAVENQLVPARNVTPEMHETFGKINHAGVKTIYPPLAQYLFSVSQMLTPWGLTGWKLMILFAEIGMFILMLGILIKLGMKQEWLVLYAWSPLVMKQFSNSLHLDVFALLFLSLMIWSFVRERFRLGYLSLALASGVKLFPVILLPLALVWTWKQNRKQAAQGFAIFSLALVLFYVPFIAAGTAVFEGLARFAGEWRVNEGVFGLIHYGVAQIPTLSLIHAGQVSRLIVAGTMTTLLAFAAIWVSKRRNVPDYFRACLFVTGALFFLAPTGNPWYFTWVFPFLYFAPLRSVVLFSGLVFLYYLDFYFSYQSTSHLFTWVKWIEYGMFYSVLAVELLWKPNNGEASCTVNRNIVTVRSEAGGIHA